MSMILTVEIRGDTRKEVQAKLQCVSDMVGEDFHGHAKDDPEDGSIQFSLSRQPEEPASK